MSLCYDFQKWTIKSLALVAVSLTIGLVLMQYAHGQNITMSQLEQQTESLKGVIDYCFQHADRPNPIQDLIDKGFLSPESKGETCISIKEKYDILNKEHSEKMQKAQSSALYLECIANETNTINDCDRMDARLDEEMRNLKIK